MKFSNKLKSAVDLLRVKFVGKRVPLAVRWQLTNRCPNRCVYCNIWNEDQGGELSTAQAVKIIDDLKKLGTQTISFSGGEPLLRNDIGKILEYCDKRSISTSMNSNGCLVPKKIDQIRTLDLLKLSLDGPAEIHDRIACYEGSYQQVLSAIEAAQAAGIKTIFTATLTKYNIRHLRYILGIAERYHTLVAFQPLKRLSKGLEHLEEIMPEENDYKNAIAELVALKKKGNPNMRNSLCELEYIYHWPRYRRLKCWAGRIFCMIGTSGELYACDRLFYNAELPNCVDSGFAQAFKKVPLDINCEGCGFCGTLELNFLLSLKLGVAGTIKKVIN